MHPRGFSPEMTEEDQKKLEGLNRLRETVMEPLAQFEESLRSGTGKGIAYGVYQLLERLNAAQNIRRMADELENMGEWNLAQEQIRLWDMLMEILDQMALVLKEQHLSPRRWSELFQLVVQSEEIAFIPQGVDEVSVGGADRSRPAAPRAVFLIGAEEGEFPRTPVSAGVFSDAAADDPHGPASIRFPGKAGCRGKIPGLYGGGFPLGEAVRLLCQLRPVRRGEIAILPGAGGSEDFPRMSGGGSLPGGFL